MTTPNPLLKKLGFSDTDRLVIIHTDDIGMCQASLTAFEHLWEAGAISSGAVMTPCPWFPATAAMCRANPDIDMGVHATLNSEWDAYRWGPISTRDPSSGLMDEQGYFFHRSQQFQESANPEAAAMEIRAQVERAVAAGIPLTHIDTHMGAVAHPKFMQSYIQLALGYRVPFLIFRMDETAWRAIGLDADAASFAARMVLELEAAGVPLLDGMAGMPLDGDPDRRMEQAKAMLAGLKPGITHFIIHPAHDTPELRAITPDWACRAADYRTFLSDELAQFIRQQGIHNIGYRRLKEIFPSK
ncbi:MAG: polysaccharide deacetylase family protein [Anaerolineales bacterium]